MGEKTDIYKIIPPLGGEPLVVSDRGLFAWDIGRTGMPFADTSIIDFDNRHRHYDMTFEWMDLEKFMEIQYKIYKKFYRESRVNGGNRLMTFDEYWVNVPFKDEKMEAILDVIKAGEAFDALLIETDKNGSLKDYQEGRNRALVLQRLGIKKVPVWIAQDRRE